MHAWLIIQIRRLAVAGTATLFLILSLYVYRATATLLAGSSDQRVLLYTYTHHVQGCSWIGMGWRTAYVQRTHAGVQRGFFHVLAPNTAKNGWHASILALGGVPCMHPSIRLAH